MELTKNSNQAPEKLYDLHLIHKMCHGNVEQISKMVEVFTEEVSQSVREVNAAFLENDFSKIKNLVHKIKPTLTYFGTTQLKEELLQIEALFINEFEITELELKIATISNMTEKIVDKMKNDFTII
jgi:HPt (histidine-containing phosphotransfer) domain-containing protein